MFNETKKLEYLYLQENKLKYLARGLFKGLNNLATLNLGENTIVLLESDLFNETRKLEYLSLQKNNLTSLPSGLFKGLLNLETLELMENQIISLNTD